MPFKTSPHRLLQWSSARSALAGASDGHAARPSRPSHYPLEPVLSGRAPLSSEVAVAKRKPSVIHIFVPAPVPLYITAHISVPPEDDERPSKGTAGVTVAHTRRVHHRGYGEPPSARAI